MNDIFYVIKYDGEVFFKKNGNFEYSKKNVRKYKSKRSAQQAINKYFSNDIYYGLNYHYDIIAYDLDWNICENLCIWSEKEWI